MSHAIQIGSNADIPVMPCINGCTHIFTAFITAMGRDVYWYAGVKSGTANLVAYNATPAISGAPPYGYLIYYSSDFLLGVPSDANIVGESVVSLTPQLTNCYYTTLRPQLLNYTNFRNSSGIYVYPDEDSAFIGEGVSRTSAFNINYNLTNASAPSAPSTGYFDIPVAVPLSFPEGYGVVNSSTDAYVTYNGVIVPSQYSNGTLTFTVPYSA